jgi:Polysaccharide deacetylase
MWARLLLNWGVLVVAVAVVLGVRYRAEAEARAPLAPPVVRLSAAATRQWQEFPAYTGTVPVLAYRAIDSAGSGFSVTPHAFAEQMLALKTAGFHAITLAQYVDFVTGRDKKLPSRPILLTFDEGRLGTYRVANDILQKYGFHGTMFTFASWPATDPGFNLSWSELRSMEKSGIWSVQEYGGSGHGYVTYNAEGARGAVYAFRQYVQNKTGDGGYLESYPAFVKRVTSNILWGERQFAAQLPGFRTLAFSVPGGNYGQVETNDPRIPQFMLPWLQHHFPVVFGGDYLARGAKERFSRGFAYRMTMNSKTSLQVLDCRLWDWVTNTPIHDEYQCVKTPPPAIGGPRPFRVHPGPAIRRQPKHPKHPAP